MSSSYLVNADFIRVRNPQKYFPTNPKIALVAEGGGQRGIFTSGILDYFIQQQFNVFDLLVGSSAGAQNLSSYLLQQPGFAKKAITELTTKRDFFQLKNILSGATIIDLDWYFNHMSSDDFHLPLDDLSEIMAKQKLLIMASDEDTFQSIALSPDKDTLMDYLKASSAVPFIYKSGVQFGHQRLVDGSVAAPIPLQPALDFQANIIVVIRTAPSGDKTETLWAWLQDMADNLRDKFEEPLLDNKPQYIKILNMLNYREGIYEKSLALIDQPPEGVIVIELAPKKPLASHLLGSSAKSLDVDYALGQKTAQTFLQNFNHWFK